MKKIVLAKKGKRIWSGAIDLACFLGLFSAIYFALIFPTVFQKDTYTTNLTDEQNLLAQSALFVKTGTYNLSSPTDLTSFSTVSELNQKTFTEASNDYTVSLSGNLYHFYTQNATPFGGTNISYDVYCQDILKLGSDTSNFAAFTVDENAKTYTLTLKTLTNEARNTAVSFFLDAYETAISTVSNSTKVQAYENANKSLMLNAILYSLPTAFGVGFIFYFLVPLFSRNGKTIGKHMTHLVVLSQDGYELKRIWLLPRFLATILIEIIGGVLSFGATALISYTMFMFAPKRRCLHDYLANSVVADERESVWFLNRDEEEMYEHEQNGQSH